MEEEVQHLLLQLNSEHGSALIIATHNERLAAAMNRTLRLVDGRLEEGSVPVARRGTATGASA